MADWLVEQSLGKPAAVYEIELRGGGVASAGCPPT